MGFSLSLRVGDGISTSFCLSVRGGGGGEVKVEDGDLCIVPKLLYKGMSALPRKVVEMYSDTWFPERLISDKWDSSLFNILLN